MRGWNELKTLLMQIRITKFIMNCPYQTKSQVNLFMENLRDLPVAIIKKLIYHMIKLQKWLKIVKSTSRQHLIGSHRLELSKSCLQRVLEAIDLRPRMISPTNKLWTSTISIKLSKNLPIIKIM